MAEDGRARAEEAVAEDGRTTTGVAVAEDGPGTEAQGRSLPGLTTTGVDDHVEVAEHVAECCDWNKLVRIHIVSVQLNDYYLPCFRPCCTTTALLVYAFIV